MMIQPRSPSRCRTHGWLKIELVNESANQEAFNIVELDKQKEYASTGADKVGNKTLSIVEAELYEAAP